MKKVNMCDDHAWAGEGNCPHCKEIEENCIPSGVQENKPSLENIISIIGIIDKNSDTKTAENFMKVIKGVVEYTLQQAADNVDLCVKDRSKFAEDGYTITDKPILNLKDKILKDLKL